MGGKCYLVLQRRNSDLPYFAVIDVVWRIQCQQTFCLLLFCLLPILDQPSGAAYKGFACDTPKIFLCECKLPKLPRVCRKPKEHISGFSVKNKANLKMIFLALHRTFLPFLKKKMKFVWGINIDINYLVYLCLCDILSIWCDLGWLNCYKMIQTWNTKISIVC